jgi:hypothetical protein
MMPTTSTGTRRPGMLAPTSPWGGLLAPTSAARSPRTARPVRQRSPEIAHVGANKPLGRLVGANKRIGRRAGGQSASCRPPGGQSAGRRRPGRRRPEGGRP